MRARLCAAALAFVCVGCSWSRYDDIVENSPIALLNRPKNITGGFGTSMAAGFEKGEAVLLVGGAPLTTAGAEFALRSADNPTLDARDTSHCSSASSGCFYTDTPVALNGADVPNEDEPVELCFVNGAGTISSTTGVSVRCTGGVEYVLQVPEPAAELLESAVDEDQPALFRFAADHGYGPALLASAEAASNVWYYPPLTRRPFVELQNPADPGGRWDKAAPRTLAMARVGAQRLLAVGIPSQSAVRLFLAQGATLSYLGCLGGTPGFGRAFATGPVLAADDDDELVVADDEIVYVFDAARLATLLPTASTECSLGALPEASLVTSFTCGSTKNISGCDASDFGAALGVGDLDGDGDGEVIVGAPNMTVRHVEGAGALIIYDVEPGTGAEAAPFSFKDIAFLSSAANGDRLGASIATPRVEERQILAAGAPGGGKAALFYCPSFLPDELKGPRCQPK
jgi:FG-GAP repeat